MQLVFLHDYQIAIWNDFCNFRVRQMQIFHERRNLPEQAVVTHYRCFAVRLATFFAKADSSEKSSTDNKE